MYSKCMLALAPFLFKIAWLHEKYSSIIGLSTMKSKPIKLDLRLICVLFSDKAFIYRTAWVDPADIFLTASQRRGTIGRGYNRMWSEEVQKERSEVKYLCTGTLPPYRKWRAS